MSDNLVLFCFVFSGFNLLSLWNWTIILIFFSASLRHGGLKKIARYLNEEAVNLLRSLLYTELDLSLWICLTCLLQYHPHITIPPPPCFSKKIQELWFVFKSKNINFYPTYIYHIFCIYTPLKIIFIPSPKSLPPTNLLKWLKLFQGFQKLFKTQIYLGHFCHFNYF